VGSLGDLSQRRRLETLLRKEITAGAPNALALLELVHLSERGRSLCWVQSLGALSATIWHSGHQRQPLLRWPDSFYGTGF
jgi:hypothetical protein